MPIEFACSQCGKQLRTPDDTAGRQAKCPQCGAVMQVPAYSSPAAQPPPATQPATPFGAPQDAQQGWNPYASPSIGGQSAEQRSAAAAGAIVPTRVDFNNVLGATWRIFRDRMGFCVLAGLLLLVIYFVIGLVVGIAGAALAVGQAAPVGPGQNPFLNMQANPVANLITTVVYWLAGTWIQLGAVHCFLKVARGQPAVAGDVFGGSPFYTQGLIVSGIFAAVGIVTTLPSLVLNNPGIEIALSFVTMIVNLVLGLMFAAAMPLIVDRNMKAGDALTKSMEVMSGNKLTLFLVFLVCGVVGGLFCVITCLIGVLFFMPFMALLPNVFYLHATGQPTGDVRPVVV